ncbi:Serine/threonine-protein phosphatase PP1-alpha [Tritrichomonas foetus]|uniref:Serine/threonine-protein phosphatase n=1 Tax=Tritrichomonas foetus TaxID=1144522 RepID=A0A1J4KSF0_9EUKA|nr:Serine/threonine-protein phosphatase PP1-alpha [Tritrichomonas foetus]|eukprot:OHT12397.1 Serine/threonine-protein phosphatase PP1-alpha [Tritrichomonas foetus]
MMSVAVQHIMSFYSQLLALSAENCDEIGKKYAIPKFEESVLVDLCHSSIEALKMQKPLLELTAPIYVIGDIHGNIFDLIRIFIIANPPPTSRFLFLGDYVDRGQFSIEVVTLLLTLQIVYPEHIYLIRGNHEFECVNSFYGFKDECSKHYSSKSLYDEFNTVFSYLPLAAIINKQIFCVHGGLSPQLVSMDQFNSLSMPMKTYDPEFVADIVWSDPSAENDSYVRSNRGTGVTFGKSAIHDFLSNFNLSSIIRAHQCIQPGISKFDGNSCYTVFSCSNYAEACQNRCGIIFITATTQIHAFSLPPLEQIERKQTKIEYTVAPSLIPKVKHQTKTLSMKIAEITEQSSKSSGNINKKVSSSSYIQPHIGSHKSLLPPIRSKTQVVI